MQTQHQQGVCEQKHAQSAITDSCLNGSSTRCFAWENIACGSSQLELQHASMRRRRAEQPGTYLLGILVTVMDEAASDFVFGPHDSVDRPGDLITVSGIEMLDSVKLLNDSCQKRWLTFLDPWHAAGWDATSLSDFTKTLRPLQHRNDLDEAYIWSISRSYLQKYIADLFTKQGFAMVNRCDVEEFLDIVHRLYSQRDAVLLPAKDAKSRCCKPPNG